MAWIKDFECLSCGSTLATDNAEKIQCFVCGAARGGANLTAKEMELLQDALEGCDLETYCRIVGREFGTNAQILPRLNTPGHHLAFAKITPEVIERYEARQKEFDALRRANGQRKQLLNKTKKDD